MWNPQVYILLPLCWGFDPTVDVSKIIFCWHQTKSKCSAFP
jgi:hypothetical protein